MLGRAPPGKTRDGQVERSPEKMDGAAFPDESRAKQRESPLALHEDLPEPLRLMRVEGAMSLVALEGNEVGKLVGPRGEMEGHAELRQRLRELAVKARDRFVLQRKGPLVPV